MHFKRKEEIRSSSSRFNKALIYRKCNSSVTRSSSSCRESLSSTKANSKRLENLNKEIPPEPLLKAPPPTPCISFKQRSGSVPDVRIVETKKEKVYGNSYHYKGLVQTLYWSNKSVQKSVLESDRKRSTSEHAMASGNEKEGHLWHGLSNPEEEVFGIGPCTNNLLHSARQKLMNL